MKLAIMSLAIVSLLSSDEIARIELIVEDISKLRENYELCQSELNSINLQNIIPVVNVEKNKTSTCQKQESEVQKYKELLNQEEVKNKILTDKIEFNSKGNPNSDIDDNIISELEKKLNIQNKLLLIKENELNNLKKEYLQIMKNKDNNKLSLENDKKKMKVVKKPILKLCKDDNTFPELIMKQDIAVKPSAKEKINIIKAATFRLKESSVLYNSIDGQKIAEWEIDASFTSNIRSENWIKVTGYFVDNIWKKAKEELWIKSSKVIQK